MILFQNFLYIITIEEFFFQTKALCLYGRVAVKPGDLLTESAVQNAVLQRNHNLVICFQLFQRAVSCPVI